MFPYLFGMSSYDLMMNLGTAAGIAVLIWSFYRRVPSWKLTIQNFGLSLAAVLLGSRGANLVRMMNDLKGRSVAEQLIRVIEDPAGNHFLGRVLAAGILYLPIAAVWAKRAGKKGEQRKRSSGRRGRTACACSLSCSIWVTGWAALGEGAAMGLLIRGRAPFSTARECLLRMGSLIRYFPASFLKRS